MLKETIMHDESTATARLTLKDDTGASAVEYGILASLIAAAIAGSVLLLGQRVVGLFESLPWT